jgi:hypothetical protein
VDVVGRHGVRGGQENFEDLRDEGHVAVVRLRLEV